MSNIGNLCIVCPDPTRSARIAAFFEQARYRVEIRKDADAALAAMRANAPDVALLLDAPEPAARLLHALRAAPETVDVSLAFADGGRLDEAAACAADDVLPADIDADAMVFRLQPLFRLATMRSEMRLRAEGVEMQHPDPAPAPGPARALYLGLDPAMTLPADFLGRDAIWESAASTAEAEAIITGPGTYDLVVIDAPRSRLDDVQAFCRDMRDNPRLFSLPFLVRMPHVGGAAARDLYRVGVSRVIGAADGACEAQAEARSLIALQHNRTAVREALRRTLTEATGHPRQAVYTEDFLNAYLDRRIAAAEAHHRALSVVHLHLPEAVSLHDEAGETACRTLSEQIARWIARLIRVEDLAARLSDSDFIVVLPDTLPSEAQVVMNRIAGVLTFTDFAVPEVYRPVKVWPLVGVAGLEPGDRPETILGRAAANLG